MSGNGYKAAVQKTPIVERLMVRCITGFGHKATFPNH